MASKKKQKIKGHCNICNSDIIFEWTEPDDVMFIYGMVKLMTNFARKTNKCGCSLIKIINKEAE